MTSEERYTLRNKTKEMFLHAFSSYMTYAFPADELMPLSCKGRFRNSEPSRGDMDDALGNFSLTLIDSLDSLYLFNELDLFERAVLDVLHNVALDTDVEVSVFETNIRILGGLLGGHMAALEVKEANSSRMPWYNKQLLDMATDVGNRLLPAFNTSTGLPYPRVNLNRGTGKLPRSESDTCTACAGTMILEFAALSRLTGNPIYEQKAAHAMSYLWKQRNRYSDLVGTVINIHNGEWVRRESGVGAGIDSYYEYLLKAYGMLGEPVYLHRFQTHYSAIERYLGSPGNLLFPFSFLSVYMHRPSERSTRFMDALQAFWPGLQISSGHLKSAVSLHEMLYQVQKYHKLLPESFTPDLDVHMAYHLMRPELIESTYLLYQATKDPYYLRVGAEMLENLNVYTRVPCGFAAIKDVRTMEHSDQMESFVLAETFKYFYLLFSNPSDISVDLSKYVFSTEAHLLPIGLPAVATPTNPTPNSSYPPFTSKRTASSSSGGRKTVDMQCQDREVMEKLPHPKGSCKSILAYNLKPVDCRFIRDAKESISYEPITKNFCEVDEGPCPQHTLLDFMHLVGMSPPKPSSTCDSVAWSHFAFWRHIEMIRKPLRSIAGVMHDRRHQKEDKNDNKSKASSMPPLIDARSFRSDNLTHLQMLRQMGIGMSVSSDGKLQLKLTQSEAETPQLGQAGLVFIQQLIVLNEASESQGTQSIKAHTFAIANPPFYGRIRLQAGPSHFGLFPGELPPVDSTTVQTEIPETSSVQNTTLAKQIEPVVSGWQPLGATLMIADPYDACSPVNVDGLFVPAGDSLSPSTNEKIDSEALSEEEIPRGPIAGSIGIVKRGGCMFSEKARNLKAAGAVGGVIIDNTPGTSSAKHNLFYMSGDATNGMESPSNFIENMPFVFLYSEEGELVKSAMRKHWFSTGHPAVGLISKEDDSPRIFSRVLRLLESWDNPSSNGGGCFSVISSIDQTKLTCEKTSPILIEESPLQSSSHFGEFETFSLNLTIFPESDESFIFTDETTTQTFSRDPTIWSSYVDQNWPTIADATYCKDMALAFLEAILSTTADPTSPFHSRSPILLSSSWARRISTCFTSAMPERSSKCQACGSSSPSCLLGLQLRVSFEQTEHCLP